MKHTLIIAAAGFAAAQLSAAPVDWSKLPPASAKTGVTFASDIQPILKASCVQCHGERRPKAQLNLTTLEGVLKGTKEGSIVTPGDSAGSFLVKSISQLDPKIAMPPKPHARRGPSGPMGTNTPAMPLHDGGPMGGSDGGPGEQPPGGPQGTNGPESFQTHLRPMGPPPKPLTAEQVGLVRAWIDQGAK